jgi:tRNA(fMet)-specific endonuclease VapC
MSASGSVLLDTTIVVDHLRGRLPTLLGRLNEATTLYLPVTALGELLYGAYKSSFRSKGLQQIENFCQLCAVLVIGELTARHYGRINAELGRAGTMIPQNDIWIAAIALEHQLPLATRDHHFSAVSGLSLLEW